MKRTALVFLPAALLCSSLAVQAASPADACAALMDARAPLVAMVDATDKATQDDLKAKVHAASARLDQILAGMAGGPDAAKAGEFKPVWDAFKNTRETEIIPAVYAGKRDEAKTIAKGIQAERMKAMKGAMGCQ